MYAAEHDGKLPSALHGYFRAAAHGSLHRQAVPLQPGRGHRPPARHAADRRGAKPRFQCPLRSHDPQLSSSDARDFSHEPLDSRDHRLAHAGGESLCRRADHSIDRAADGRAATVDALCVAARTSRTEFRQPGPVVHPLLSGAAEFLLQQGGRRRTGPLPVDAARGAAARQAAQLRRQCASGRPTGAPGWTRSTGR